MTAIEKFRGWFFWVMDCAKGKSVSRHYKEIVSSFQDDAKFHELRLKKIARLLRHATTTTKFYSGYLGTENVAAFPVIDKNLIRTLESDFLSSSFKREHIIPVITSGSTGTPFRTYQDRNKRIRNTADTIYFAQLAGYELGNRLYYFKIWSDYNRKSSFRKFMQNIVPIDVLNLKTNVNHVISDLNTNSSAVSFLGYVSAFETICRELDKMNNLSHSLKVNSIITMSEGLNDYTKKSGEKYFGCPVLSRYSNIENGILAQQTLDDHDNFLVNTASYLIEIMDMKKDRVLALGEVGRIIVTDFYNYAMPLIRYDTGDIGVLDKVIINGVVRTVLSRIEGRKLDQIFNTKGELISSYIVYRNMWDYTEIEQYQFVQRGPKDYLFRISMSGRPFEREERLIQQFKEYLGQDAKFSIEYVNEIPLLDSGKRKKVVNEMVQ